MVWKIIAPLSLVCCLLLVSPTLAKADSIYTDGNISSTYLDIFRDILEDTSLTDDYLVFRSSQYEYTLLVGEIDFQNNIFTSQNYRKFVISTSQSGYSGGVYHLNSSLGTSFSLNAEDYIVYSNLGYYPRLIERSTYYEYAILTTICIVGCCMLIRSIFKFNLRLRR